MGEGIQGLWLQWLGVWRRCGYCSQRGGIWSEMYCIAYSGKREVYLN